MTTLATAAAAPPRPHRVGAALVGTGTLVRFALRRDRVRTPVWLGALAVSTVASAQSFSDLYASEASRASIAQSMSTPAGLAMSGPRAYLADYNFGSMTGHQMLGFTGVLVGLMSILMVVRHTRAEEESGRAELVHAGVLGRHAQLAAALAVAVIANLGLAALLAAGLGALGLDGMTWAGSALYGAAHAAIGAVFAGVAAVTVQITEHARGASGMAFAVLGLAYVLRAAGDIGDGALSWLSPIGWAQATYVYVEDRWWPLLVAVVATAALAAAAFELSSRRDLGAGLRQPRAGAATASRALTTPFGFALRLHRAMLLAFAIGMALLGVMYGSVLDQVERMIADVALIQEMLAARGGVDIIASFTSMIMVVLSIVSSVSVVLAVGRMRSEELAGRAEPVLATAVSRAAWMLGHLAVAVLGGSVVLLSAGLGLGVAGAAATGDGTFVTTALGAAAAYLPALWVVGGVAALLFGWAPRATHAAWLVVVYSFVVGYLGQLLQFPAWLNTLSPFGHVPEVPAEEFAVAPWVALTALAAALLAIGVAGFGRRDLGTT